MPRKSNKQADLSAVLDTNPVLDMDNVYWSKVGWAYRHYKSEDKLRYWDEILVAGEALADDGTPDVTAQDFGTATPVFETGDSIPSVEIPTIDSFAITGSLTAVTGLSTPYQTELVGENLAGASYNWTTTDSGAVIATGSAADTGITFSAAGTYVVSCAVSTTVGDVTASDIAAIEVVVEDA